MKRYRFRLETVARIRRLQEDQARADLLAARHRLADAGASRARHEDAYSNRGTGTGRRTRGEFLTTRERDQLIADAVTAARVAEANALALVGQRAETWAAAARAASALERLDRRGQADHDIERARDEQRELDELVVARRARDRQRERDDANEGTDR